MKQGKHKSLVPVRAAFGLVALLTLAALAPVRASAQMFGGEGDRVSGVVVSIRGDIVQVRPRYSEKLVRVIVDDKTTFNAMEMLGQAKLKAGERVFGMGQMNDKGTVQVMMLMLQDGASIGTDNGRGVTSVGIGKAAMVNARVGTVKPLTLVDANGKTLPVTPGGFMPVMKMGKTDRAKMLVGSNITASGERTIDKLLHAKQVSLQPGGGMFGPGGGAGEGSLFGKVVAVKGGKLEITPRFEDESVTVTLASDCAIVRQIALDPDTIQPGDVLTAQGKRTGGTYDAPTNLTVSVFLSGKQRYPRVSGGGGFAAMLGGDAKPGMTLTGKVVTLSPFVMLDDAGHSVTVAIPGQTPYVDLKAATLGDIKPTDKVVLIGKEGKDGGLVVSKIVIGASPIVGFGGG